ncbi:hypothetical protein [Paenarthrobacter sp. YJN-5]|uniref:hypothetical protein n=1 Tax=Paenarthrobacter sp. YJN-5 TaxID=2735316 RepID=UPI001878F961|nr:hypothetical protein [Paenarthrobacter sp. YJN-5]QOT19617.1 hypothetical protein HMI59_23670 [Paenarthrobacter sp. YJN-5]
MTSAPASTASPVDLFQFTSDSEDYESPTNSEAVVALLGTALLAVPVGIAALAVAPFVLGARAVRGLAAVRQGRK